MKNNLRLSVLRPDDLIFPFKKPKKTGKEVTFSTFFVSRVCLTRVQSQCRDSRRSENLGGQKGLYIYVMCTLENPGEILWWLGALCVEMGFYADPWNQDATMK